nr:DUF4328 domain-containing protein [Streptomyces sp. SID13031]
MWRSYADVKRLVYGQLSENELDRGVQSIANSGPLLNVVCLLVIGTGVLFLIWLWRARENTELFALTGGASRGAQQPGGLRPAHRHERSWVIGSWICPIVQFWYPLQVVEDVVRASEPADTQDQALGQSKGHTWRALLYGWWASWAAFWVIIVGGGSFAVISFFVWVVRLVDRREAADATGDYVDIYDLQGFMVRTALAVNIGFSVAAALLVVAGIAIALLMLRTNSWQDGRMAPSLTQPPAGPPQYAPRPPDFPTYAPYPPSSAPSRWQP